MKHVRGGAARLWRSRGDGTLTGPDGGTRMEVVRDRAFGGRDACGPPSAAHHVRGVVHLVHLRQPHVSARNIGHRSLAGWLYIAVVTGYLTGAFLALGFVVAASGRA